MGGLFGRIVFASAAFAGVASCATSTRELVNERVAARLAKYETTGEVSRCLSVPRITSIQAVTESKFLVRTGVNDFYLVETPDRCNGATRPNNRIQYVTSIPRLCQNQIVNVVENTSGITVGGCGFGAFQELKEKEPEDTKEDDEKSE